jgi:2-methylisocitrate lyase-like PEP mutase family enzyme
MSAQSDKAARFLSLHRPGEPLLMANVWDVGSAKAIAALGYAALATTSSGFAQTLGRLDGSVTGEEALAHSAAIVAAADLPVSADLENCFANGPAGVAETIRGAIATGLAGGSIEDFTGDEGNPIYPFDDAVARVAAAAEAAHAGGVHFVLTARCENLLHGRDDLDDTIARLQAYERAGADVLFAPGLRAAEDIERVVSSVSLPVNVLVGPGRPTVTELANLGVARTSVGGAFAFAALGAAVEAATELLEDGTYTSLERAATGIRAARSAFS